MTLAERIAIVLDTQALPEDNHIDIEEWDREIQPWKTKLRDRYDALKRRRDFMTSAQIARAEIVQEMMNQYEFEQYGEDGH